MRADEPSGSSSPGGPEQSTGPEAPLHPGEGTSGGSAGAAGAGAVTGQDTGQHRADQSPAAPVDSQPEPTTEGEVHATTQTEQANEELQSENAETALDQPSDGSGGE